MDWTQEHFSSVPEAVPASNRRVSPRNAAGCKKAGKAIVRRSSAEGTVMKEVVSELLQRKEQREEDLYFESLNRGVIEKLHRLAVTDDRSGTGTPRRMVRASVQEPDTGR